MPNPNAAFYDHQLECTDCNNCALYVSPEIATVQKRSLYKRQSDFIAINITLYVSVEGVEDNNTFVLESTVGDSTGKVHIYKIFA